MYQFYLIAWWSYILLVDAVLALKTRRHLVFNRNLIHLVILSSAFWCMFELINLRLQNWFYVNIPYPPVLRFAGYLLAYGTVIPALYLTKEMLSHVLPEMKFESKWLGNYPAYMIPSGFLLLALAVAFPTYFFPVAWIFLAFILDGINYWSGYDSFLRHLERGSLKEILATALAGIVCGVLWESWNYWSVVKWIYTVPFFEELKLFEMPLLGYIGFAFFSIETIAFLNFFQGNRFLISRRWSISFLALIFSVFTFFLIDRGTVFSHTAGVKQLTFLTEGQRQELTVKGVETSHGIDPALLGEQQRKKLALLHLKGLGMRNLERLDERGIETIAAFSGLSPEELSSIIEDKNMRRVRIYVRAAQKQAARNPY